jgi:hypothetical protein
MKVHSPPRLAFLGARVFVEAAQGLEVTAAYGEARAGDGRHRHGRARQRLVLAMDLKTGQVRVTTGELAEAEHRAHRRDVATTAAALLGAVDV